jgi:hypothetical protein
MRRIWFAFCSVLMFSVLGSGQVGTQASIFGTVTDSSGANIAGAVVTATNISTNAVNKVTSDPQGNFNLLALPIGTYRISVAVSGFKKWENSSVELAVGDQRRIAPVLQVGAINETITVSSSAEAIQTERADVESVVQMQQIRELPLDTRNPLELAILAPGIAETTTQGGGERGTFIQGYGLRGNKTAFQLDGSDTNAPMDEGGTGVPNVDAVAEFSVQTSNFSAESGRSPMQVLAVTKSGTNQLHGTLFEFFQNDLFNAKNAFADTKNRVRFNQFGGTIGGPIVKDKTFFFGSFQGTVTRNADVINDVAATDAMKQGDFSALDFSQSPHGCLWDPVNSVCFANNGIPNTMPASRIDPASAYFLPLFFSPTSGNLYNANAVGVNKTWESTIRVDHQITSSQRLYGRYVNVREPHDALFEPNNGVEDPRHPGSDDVTQHNLGLNYTWIKSANTLFTLSGGMLRTRENYSNPGYGKQNDVQLAGIQGFPTSSRQAWIGPPDINITGYSTYGFGGGWGTPGSLWGSTYNTKASVSHVHGAHNLSVGTEWGDRRTYAEHGSFSSRGEFEFGANDYTGNPFGDYLLGYISATNRNVPLTTFGNDRAPYFALYGDDTWRVRPNLTLALGLRFEHWLAHHNVNDAISTWDPTVGKMVLGVDSHGNPNLNAFAVTQALAAATTNLWTTAKAVGYPSGLYDPNNDWAPRLGITYRPFANRQVVLRAGFGSYYNSYTGNRGASAAANVPDWTVETQFIDPAVQQTWDNVWPSQPVGIGNFFVAAPSAFIKPARTNEWNVSVQTALPANTSLTVSYVGNHGPNEISANEYNVPQIGSFLYPFPSFNRIEIYQNLGKTWYNALQVRGERRFKDGLSFGMNYSFSRSMQDKVADAEDGAAKVPFAPDFYTRSRSTVDRRHIESATLLWQLPYGRGKRFGSQANKFVDGVLGGWQLAFIQTAQSGLPLGISDSEGNLGNGWDVRARQIGNAHVNNPNKNMWFNTAAFTNYAGLTPSAGFFALASPFGILEGPGEFTLNTGLSKSFRVTESKSLQFRWEAFNLPNRVNLINPDTEFADGPGAFGHIFGSGPSRYMQFGLKFTF